MLIGILAVLRLPPQSTFWRFLAGLHLGVARQLLHVQRCMRERVWEAAHVRLTEATLDTDTTVHTQSGTQKVRMSTGIELQVLVPRLLAPLRFDWAYNPLAYRGIMQAPLVLDRSDFPNAATFRNAFLVLGTPTLFRERQFLLRFSIGRTFGGRR